MRAALTLVPRGFLPTEHIGTGVNVLQSSTGNFSEVWHALYPTRTDVVIVKNGRRICGTGGCLANAPLHQNKSYFEFKIQSTGIWGIGVATQKANLNQIPLGRDVHSLVMRNDGALYYNNEEKNRLPANNLPQEGDVVGITYDHVELNVYLNGKNMHCPASGIRGTVYPVVYVDDSAILDCQFSEFYHTPPPGFEKILFEQQIF
ncbi:PREDICTED: SPRY domain-containing protein 7 [Aptenodytes forsteri]|uniref:SPRY domain-containing protein 7 n=1 Tax=Aptenodytes forsteri TaxID=9233 RepID=UPI0004F4842B|nr:PREDICTED: SPRY domain-containing protein 7 [Aptenodytes forsteri]